MPRNPHKRRCAQEGCRAWAVRGKEHCRAHSRPKQAEAEPEDHLPTFESEILWLVKCRRKAAGVVEQRLDDKTCTPAEALRYLAVTAQFSRTLAGLLARYDSGGSGELDRFLAAVSARARELSLPAEGETAMND